MQISESEKNFFDLKKLFKFATRAVDLKYIFNAKTPDRKVWGFVLLRANLWVIISSNPIAIYNIAFFANFASKKCVFRFEAMELLNYYVHYYNEHNKGNSNAQNEISYKIYAWYTQVNRK